MPHTAEPAAAELGGRRHGNDWESGLRYKTRSGIRVRSKIEKIIADFLFQEGIRFVYEPRVRIGEFETRPDFYLPDYRLLYEHFGMDDEMYCRAALEKIDRYRRSGVPFVYTTFNDEPDIERVIEEKLAEATPGR